MHPRKRNGAKWFLSISIFAVLILMSLLSVAKASYIPASGWRQYQADAAHDGYTASEGPTQGTLAWTYKVGGSPDGIIAFGSQVIVSGSGVRSFSEMNGSTLVYFSPYQSLTTYPASGGGLLYYFGVIAGSFGGYANNLIAQYISSGQLAWDLTVSNPGSSSLQLGGMPTYSTGVLYYAGYGRYQASGFDATSGSQIWTVSFPNQVSSCLTYGSNLVLVTFVNIPKVEALNAQSGKSVWNFTSNTSVPASASYSNGAFYFGTVAGAVFSVSSSGQVIWSRQLQGAIQSTPAVADGVVYVASSSGTLYSVNASDGSQNWNFTDPNPIVASPAVSFNGIVYFADSAGVIYALNANSGALVWKYDTGVSITSSLAVDNGYLFAVDTNGTVYAFGPVHPVTSQSITSSNTTTQTTTSTKLQTTSFVSSTTSSLTTSSTLQFPSGSISTPLTAQQTVLIGIFTAVIAAIVAGAMLEFAKVHWAAALAVAAVVLILSLYLLFYVIF